MTIDFWGALLLGVLLGWFVYYINRYRTGALQLSDITTLVSVIGTASATLFFSKPDKPNTLFAGFCIGLFIGFFAYLAFLIGLVLRSQNFTLDWFLDGRRKTLPADEYIPAETGVTVRPSVVAALLPEAPDAAPQSGAFSAMVPHARSFRTAPVATRIGDVDPEGPVRLRVVLKPKTEINTTAYACGRGLSRDLYRSIHGTEQKVIDRVTAYASRFGLAIESADTATHSVVLTGTFAQAQAAFRPDRLGVYSDAKGRRFAARSGCLWLPESLTSDVVAVMGFDRRPASRPHSRISSAVPQVANSSDPVQIAQRYGFPLNATGKGQSIGLIELGGGYDPQDLAVYFQSKNVKRTGSVVDVAVDGGANAPNGDLDSDREVQLDIDVAASVAPGADIRVYFAPNSDPSFYEAVQAAISDAVHIISISWGHAEATWAAHDRDAMDQLFQTAAAQNISVIVASGDSGSVDESPDGQNNVDFPASSPSVLGCGGTSIAAGEEVAWNNASGASGGGYSAYFARPNYQSTSSGNRGVPDVSGVADPDTGYNIRVNGVDTTCGGTSAVAPLWAALISLCNQQIGRSAGFVNPTLYSDSSALNDITIGGNGGYECGAGWDPVTGLGSPKGAAVLTALRP